MTKFLIILDLVLAVLCAGRRELQNKNAVKDIQQVSETIVVVGNDTLQVDTIKYE